FAPLAVILRRDKFTIFLVVLAAAAWIVSFGKFLPVLYWPLYELLPYFNKFRVPSLIQGLVLLSAILLAGRGLQAVWEKAKSNDENRLLIGKRILIAGAIVAGFCLLFVVFQGALKETFFSAMAASRPRMQPDLMQEAYSGLLGDVGKFMLLTVVLYGSAAAVLLRKAPLALLAAVVAFAAVIELYQMDKMVLHPTPPQYMGQYLAADDVVMYLQKDPSPNRILPLTQNRNPDWYMNHRLESIDGYSASKPRLYQDAIDSLSLNNPKLLRMMNTRYFISDRPISHQDLEEVFVGQKERVYRYNKELPRAFLVSQFELIKEPHEAFRYYRQPDFDFGKIAVLQESPAEPLQPDAKGAVRWLSRSPDHLELEVETDGRQLLVLSEVYYPSGWKATLDGKPADILRTNYMFRSVEIPAGKHIVRMDFKPLSAGQGSIFSLISWLLVLAGLAVTTFMRRKTGKA
ncbi:YfhO family protein, partial [bacterium]|nr:YfhO family protein [bacterium]